MSDAFRARYGDWALVAGASEGLGEAFARALAARGLGVVLAARRAEKLEALAAELRARHGVPVRTLRQDLADDDAAARLAQATADVDLGLLVYNAAYAPAGPFCDTDADAHRRVLAVNCRTPALLCRELGARLRARGRGGLLLMGSLAGFQGAPGIAHYAASKAWTLVLAEGLWAELSPHGVDVLACVAGATRTPGLVANPPPKRALAPPPQEPDEVVREALDALGRGPRLIPGRWNRLASFVLRHLVSRRRAVRIMAASTDALRAEKAGPPA